MTIEQKETVTRMRAEGNTFSAIAESLGISVSTIKSYWQKSSQASKPVSPGTDAYEVSGSAAKEKTQDNTMPPVTPGICRQCGVALNLHIGNQMKRFCSERCRQKWWRAHPGLVTAKASVSVCVGCGRTFKNGGNPARRFCSRTCYTRHRLSGRTANE